MKTIVYNGTSMLVTEKVYAVLTNRMARQETRVREVVANHIANVSGDAVIATAAVGRVSTLRVALDTVRTLGVVSRGLLKTADVCNVASEKIIAKVMTYSTAAKNVNV
jgi:hypothetical protein